MATKKTEDETTTEDVKVPAFLAPGSTFASRAAARNKAVKAKDAVQKSDAPAD